METMSSVSETDKLLYLLEKSSRDGRLAGRKKLMKLAFFAEYFDPESDTLVPNQRYVPFDFTIFKYGPFSKDVMNAFDSLKHSGLVEEDSDRMQHLIEITDMGSERSEEVGRRLTPEEREHIEEIVKKFGGHSGGFLENMSLDYLGISKKEKEKFRGTSVEELIEPA